MLAPVHCFREERFPSHPHCRLRWRKDKEKGFESFPSFTISFASTEHAGAAKRKYYAWKGRKLPEETLEIARVWAASDGGEMEKERGKERGELQDRSSHPAGRGTERRTFPSPCRKPRLLSSKGMSSRLSGVRYFRLENALEYRSRSSPFPFIIAHECREEYLDEKGEPQMRMREYYAFDSVHSFLSVKHSFPHSHEVVFPRTFDQKQRGRIVFDFDIEEEWYESERGRRFVSPSFYQDVERTAKKTLRTFYSEIDVSKFRFIWLKSANRKKYSRHLIICGLFLFSDWVSQLGTFYSLFMLVAKRSGLFYYIPIEKLVDVQVARKNATMRMLGNSKIGGSPLVAEGEEPVSFYDSLIQPFRHEDLCESEMVGEGKLLMDKVSALCENAGDEVERKILSNIPQLKKALFSAIRYETASLELTEECLEYLSILEGRYEVREVEEGRILLNRVEAGPCPVSGKGNHASDGGFIAVSREGYVRFYCFRGCVSKGGKKGLLLGKKEAGDGEDTEKKREEALRKIRGNSLRKRYRDRDFADRNMEEEDPE
jgi:hypothetical protein